MPVSYYGSRISPHMTRTPEGFLICHDVPINRVGVYQYKGRELGMDGEDADKTFNVTRRAEEVFHPATLASFEGKPVTDEHPPENVTPENIQQYGKGHVQNVRRGQGKDAAYTVADLVITDPQLIGEIDNGKREVSCGYPCTYVPMPNGIIDQREMRGNHVAIVDEGRAGHHASIKDHAMPTNHERGKNMSAEKKSGIWGRMLKALAADEATTPEDLEEAAKLGPKEAAHDETPAVPVKPTVPSPEGKAPATEAHDEEPTLASIAATLSGICARLDKLEAGKAPAQDEDKDALQEIIGEEEAETPAEQAAEEETGKESADNYDAQENEESQTIPPEDVPEQRPTADAQTVKKLAADVRSVLAKNITDPKAFKAAAKDAASAITAVYGKQTRDNSGYAQFIKTTSQAAKARVAHDGVNGAQRVYAETQNAYNQINPHTHKEVK